MCPFCRSILIKKKGFFTKKAGRAGRVQRYLCKACHRQYSDATGSPTYREKKPHVDQPLFRLLTAGVAQRASARILGVHPVTVARKLCRLGERARRRLHADNRGRPVGPTVVFDEMETFEHSKCKPLSIAVAVEEGSRRILAAEVASMPAKGRLAAIARRRYGPRKDGRRQALAEMCAQVAAASPTLATVKSDECPRYPSAVRRHLPGVLHVTFKGRRGCVVGQGELKAGGFDPLFSLNHTCAMIRDRVKRLSRRTWCTTKRPDRLQLLLDLYAWHHNQALAGAGRLVTV